MKNFNYRTKCNFCGSMSHFEKQCWKKYPHSAPAWYNPNNQYNNPKENNNYNQVNSDQLNCTKSNNHYKYQSNYSDEHNYKKYNHSNYNNSYYPKYQYNSNNNNQQNF